MAIDEPDESNLDGYEVNEVQEIYETDITIDQANSKLQKYETVYLNIYRVYP